MQASRSYPEILAQLSASSVSKHFDAYADIEWDAAEHSIDPEDPRFELTPDDPLEETDWYRGLPQPTRARLGLYLMATMMKTGIQFEAILSRGLLELSSTLPNGSPEFRYAYHELIEEGQHSLMFQEFINRTRLDVTGMSALEVVGSRHVPRLGRVFPERLLIHVIAGEWPIDHVQRTALARERLHPLLRRIMHIHVIEEARHLCFAARYLEEHVPRLSPRRLSTLRIVTPFILKTTATTMMRVPPSVVREFRIPHSAVRQAHTSARQQTRIIGGLRPVHSLAVQLGIVTSRTETLWRRLRVLA
ncbi:MAG: diiron oxygenase [Deltaproteobacteria bacterium]|nr:diiron oxygenase [Deltaproteobacteria bacterium]